MVFWKAVCCVAQCWQKWIIFSVQSRLIKTWSLGVLTAADCYLDEGHAGKVIMSGMFKSEFEANQAGGLQLPTWNMIEKRQKDRGGNGFQTTRYTLKDDGMKEWSLFNTGKTQNAKVLLGWSVASRNKGDIKICGCVQQSGLTNVCTISGQAFRSFELSFFDSLGKGVGEIKPWDDVIQKSGNGWLQMMAEHQRTTLDVSKDLGTLGGGAFILRREPSPPSCHITNFSERFKRSVLCSCVVYSV